MDLDCDPSGMFSTKDFSGWDWINLGILECWFLVACDMGNLETTRIKRKRD